LKRSAALEINSSRLFLALSEVVPTGLPLALAVRRSKVGTVTTTLNAIFSGPFARGTDPLV
jgi:hypothetical protein